MQWVRKVLLSTLAVLWLPVTIHCQLESLSGLEFLSCCAHAEQAPHQDQTPHQDQDCTDDGCTDVESGLYETHHQSLGVRASLLDRIVPIRNPAAEVKTAPLSDRLDPPETAPPEICSHWRFSLRVALSPRAPSSDS